MSRRIGVAVRGVLVAAVLGILSLPADAEPGGMFKGRMKGGQKPVAEASAPLTPEAAAFSPTRADRVIMQERGLVATGLMPVYPAEADCPVINSAFAAQTRGDGSFRSQTFYHGYHGGADIPVPEGTPIVAMADGTVVYMHEGENIGGISVVLQHAPQDTGLPLWTYTEYKHLREMPALSPGQRVTMGEVIAHAGLSGTTGGYYGASGHSHLHLTAFAADRAEYRATRMLVPIDGLWMDPLALFRAAPHDSHALRELGDEQKATVIAYRDSNGRTVPEDARVIWPFVCAAR